MASRPPRPGELLDHHPPTLAAFHDQVAELAHTHGWLTLEADGFLVLTRGSALAIVAIRSERDRLTPDQHQLLGELRRHPHVLAECWRPSDLSRIKTWLAQPSPHYQGQAPW